MDEAYNSQKSLTKFVTSRMLVLVSILALAVAIVLSGCSGANVEKAVAGTWNLETMDLAGQTVSMSWASISIEAKEDGSAVLTNKSTNATIDYKWEPDKSKSSSSDLIYVVFSSGDHVYETTIRPSESTMSMVLEGGIVNTYRKAS